MIILGIDPGTDRFGYSLYDSGKDKILAFGSIKLKGPNADTRLGLLNSAFEDLYFEILPPEIEDLDVVAYELMFSAGNNADAPLAVFTWLLRMWAKSLEKINFLIKVQAIPHASVYKEVFGRGNANKEDIRKYLEERYEIKIGDTDASDALATALAYATYEPGKNKKKKLMGPSTKH